MPKPDTIEWTRADQDDLGRMTTSDLGLPSWADNTARALLCDDEAAHAVIFLAGRHERVLTRLDNGTVLIDNRGRGLTTLTAEQAHALALFLLGNNAREDGLEWGTTPEEVTGDYVPGVRTYGMGDVAEDAAYAYAERTSTPQRVMHRPRLTVVGPWTEV